MPRDGRGGGICDSLISGLLEQGIKKILKSRSQECCQDLEDTCYSWLWGGKKKKKVCLIGLPAGQDTRSTLHSPSSELLRSRMSKPARIQAGFWGTSASCPWLKMYNCNCRWGKASKKVEHNDDDGATQGVLLEVTGHGVKCLWCKSHRISTSWCHIVTSDLHWLETKLILYLIFIATTCLNVSVPMLRNAFWVNWELYTGPTGTRNWRQIWTKMCLNWTELKCWFSCFSDTLDLGRL